MSTFEEYSIASLLYGKGKIYFSYWKDKPYIIISGYPIPYDLFVNYNLQHCDVYGQGKSTNMFDFDSTSYLDLLNNGPIHNDIKIELTALLNETNSTDSWSSYHSPVVNKNIKLTDFLCLKISEFFEIFESYADWQYEMSKYHSEFSGE